MLDECLSPSYVHRLVAMGHHDAVHPAYIGLSGVRDDTIIARAFADDRIVITANGRDYRKLLARMTLHPGAIIVEALEREQTWQQIVLALDVIEQQASPADDMVSRVVEVSAADGVRDYQLP